MNSIENLSLKIENKSQILKLIVQIVSEIRMQSISDREKSFQFQLLENFLHGISIQDGGIVYAIFNNSKLESLND